MEKTIFDLNDLAGIDRYKLLTGLVIPRPIGWVGSVDVDGHRNLAPYSYFNVVAATPPTALFSAGRPGGRIKDSLANVLATGVFTLSIVDESLTKAMHASSEQFPPDVDEFEQVGLTAVTGVAVAAPYVGEALAVLECRVSQIVDLGDPISASAVFGDIVRLHVANDVLDGTRIDHDRLRAVGRIAGTTYVTTANALFEVET
ncbi:MAG: flavin reductase family protein [Acidimicrobiia bacterium]|nr:flavin reductase family protein [Acidimicrobiia bacterium]MDX2467814.1 flavin reductase family protein [Acidimicrobiia bacterium]